MRVAVAGTFGPIHDGHCRLFEHAIAGEEPSIDAFVVSPELTMINDLCRKRGFEPLTGIVAPYVLADDGDRTSSTRIVRGEIDEYGTVLD